MAEKPLSLLIVVEGNTCVGKTTLAKGLADVLVSNGFSAVYMKSLPSEKNEKRIKEMRDSMVPLDRDLMFLDDFYDTFDVVNGHLTSGECVVKKEKEFQLVGVTFCCNFVGGEEKLSHEHTGLSWIAPQEIIDGDYPGGLKKEIEAAVALRK